MQVVAGNYEKGAVGEVAVARVLGDLSTEFVVLHDLNIPGSKANVDHLVIGPTGVFMIDAKCWSGRLTAGDGTLWRGPTPIRHECSTAAWEAQQISNVVGRAVQPVICFVGTALPEAVQHCDGVTVCESDALLFVVRDSTRWLDPASIAAIAAAARPLVRTDGRRGAATAPVPAPREAQTTAMPLVASAAVGTTGRRSRRATGPRRSGRRPIMLRVLPAVLVFGLLGGGWALAPAIANYFANSLSGSAPAGAAPASTAAGSTTSMSSTTATTTTSVGVDGEVNGEVNGVDAPSPFLPPLIVFACPTPGAGWMVTAAPSEFRSDPVGFGMWYLAPTGAWVRWGTFRSGISGPDPFGPVPAGTAVQIKVERDASLDPTDAAQDLQAIAPADPC